MAPAEQNGGDFIGYGLVHSFSLTIVKILWPLYLTLTVLGKVFYRYVFFVSIRRESLNLLLKYTI